jgi:signal transduction histidine kinase/HAMP domain-containing protein
MPRLHRFSADRVRTRLLAAFAILLLAGVALAVVGWLGMRSMQRELAGYEQEVLPGIARALELAERIAQLAAITPHLADSRTPETLESDATVVASMLDDIKRRSQTLPPSGALQPLMNRRLEGVDRDLSDLITLTKLRQSIDVRLERQITALGGLGTQAHAAGIGRTAGNPVVGELWSSLVLGAMTNKAATLGRLQADVEALYIAARRGKAFAAYDAAFVRDLDALANGPDNILALRRDLLDYEGRVNYLVFLTRSNADRLSDEVALHVAQLRNTAAARNDSVQRAIRSGQTGLVVLAIVCIAIGLGATRYVRRLVAQIEKITHVMSRLAHGDTAQPTPATTRRDELGELARSFEVFRDNLLAKQRLLADLKSQRELLEAVHESLTDALAVFDAEHRLILWNSQFAKLLGPHGIEPGNGVSRRDMLQRLPEGTTWAPPGREAQPFVSAKIDGIAVCEHVELRLPIGHVLDVRSRAMPDGGTVTLITDVTAPRAVEARLQHSQKLDVLGQLTGGVAHDFNNYLGTILGNLSLLEDQVAADPLTHTRWRRVQRAATSAAALTRRLLAFARRQPLQAEQVPIDEMIEEMQDLIEYSAGPQVTVNFDLQSAPMHVHVDRGQLENSLLNLVLNSAAAMPNGGELDVRTRPHPEGVAIEVRDTGRGIPDHQQGQVFDPFFTTKPVGEGSGLGLSIVYGFVKQSGGDVTLSSRPAKGTTVTMRFPAAEAPTHPTSARHAAAPAALLDGAHVLLVDDDDAFRATVTDILMRDGLRVTAVSCAEQALTLLERGDTVDVLLSDICLGSGMDGLRLARLARDRWPELPLGIMSGLSPELLPNAEELDLSFAFVHKPFEPAQLATWLAGLLRDTKAPSAETPAAT